MGHSPHSLGAIHTTAAMRATERVACRRECKNIGTVEPIHAKPIASLAVRFWKEERKSLSAPWLAAAT